MVGVLTPSDEYVGVATTLLDSLHGDPHLETSLLQLQTLFGPMLASALQLVDKREVVRVSLPSERYVYQVSGSTGRPYTLYLDLADLASAVDATSAPVGPALVDGTAEGKEGQEGGGPGPQSDDVAAQGDESARLRRDRLRREATTLQRLYCPCPGFAYNSLAGDKNVLCKHLLAALIAWKTERAVKTEGALSGVIDLLGLRERFRDTTESEVVKSEVAT